MSGNGKDNLDLEYYEEHPDQAINKLQVGVRIKSLRSHLKEFMEPRLCGPSELISEMYSRVNTWAISDYASAVAQDFTAVNLRDFIKHNPSNLKMASRLLVHTYLWISFPKYRSDWGGISPNRPPLPKNPDIPPL